MKSRNRVHGALEDPNILETVANDVGFGLAHSVEDIRAEQQVVETNADLALYHWNNKDPFWAGYARAIREIVHAFYRGRQDIISRQEMVQHLSNKITRSIVMLLHSQWATTETIAKHIQKTEKKTKTILKRLRKYRLIEKAGSGHMLAVGSLMALRDYWRERRIKKAK